MFNVWDNLAEGGDTQLDRGPQGHRQEGRRRPVPRRVRAQVLRRGGEGATEGGEVDPVIFADIISVRTIKQ